jgi:hypothetical protein
MEELITWVVLRGELMRDAISIILAAPVSVAVVRLIQIGIANSVLPRGSFAMAGWTKSTRHTLKTDALR